MPKPTNMITPAPNVVKPGVQTNNSQPKTATVSTPSAYQQNLQQPLKQDKWYAGDYPTSREMLGKIYSIYQEDREYGQKMLDNFHAEQQNSSSRYYNPYSATTNRAVQNLANLGVDASQINDEWYKNNPGWQSYLKFNGTTNTPSSPGKRASVQEKIAFEIYQLGKADEDTKKMKSEWDAMKDELSYWANRSDLNLSDDEIVDRVTKEMQSKYPTLARMQESMTPGKALLELNEGSDFSVDNMYGTIWAARNGGGVGSAEANTMLSALGNGNVWNDNPQIRGKLNRNDKNTYSPYSVGMTLNDAGLYFGVSSFDDESLEQIRKGIDWNDQTAVRYYNDAVAANENTKKAEAELANLKQKVNGWIANGRSEEWIQKKISTYMEDGEWPTLRDMDKSIETGGKLVDTTRKVDYRRQDFDTFVGLQVGIRDSKMTGGETTNKIKESAPVIEQEAAEGTETPAMAESPEESPVMTESDIAAGKATDKKINDAGGVVDNATTEDEKIVWASSGSSFYDGTKLFFQDAKDNMQSVVIGMAGNAEKAVTQNYFETSLDTVYDIYAYEAKSAQLAEDKNAFAELKAKYGDVSLLQKEFRPSFTATVNDDAGNEVNVSLEWSDAKQEYTVKDISAPDRGIYGMDDDIFVHMYEAGSEANELMRVAHNVANEQSEEARQIRKAHDALLAGGEEAANEVEQYKRLSAAIQRGEAELSAGEQKYNEQKQSFEDSMKNLEIINSALEDLGMDTVDINEAQAMLDYMSQFYDEPALPMSDETAYQWVNKLAQYSGGEATQDMAKAKLRDYMGNIDSEIDTLEMAIAYIEDKGFTVPDRVRRNMQFKLEDLQNKKKDIEYSMLLTETPSEEMDKAVEAGKAFEEKYGEKAMYQWNEIFTDPEENVEDKYSTLKNKQRFDLYDQLTYQEKNEDGTVSEKKFELITPDEEKLYYYLLGKGVEKYGEEFAELWNVEQYNAEQFQRMKNLIADIFAESNDFVAYMSDDDYGVWTTREADYSGKWAQGEVDRGGLSGTIANIGATLSTPLESVSSAYYMIDRAISGKRFNADTKYGRISDTKEGIRAATFQSIKDTYGEGSIQEKLASLGYEIYANRGDSLMNSLAFGSIFHFEGKFGKILSSFGGSTPMGATAAMSAAAKAVENGANLDQVWLIAGATFLSETMTEAITMSNIKDALGTAEELSGDTLKDIIKDWLTKDGLEEALGESINDIAENAADRWAAMMNNSNYHDEFGQLVEKYLAEGYENDQAEEMALEEQAKGVLHTAFVSYLSAGSEALMATGKAAMNGMNYYRAVTKARQQSGYNESTLGNMVRSFRTRNGKADITAEAKATEHMMDENMSEKLQSMKTTPEQKEAATDIVTIEQAKNSDESTKSAALSSVLTTNTKKGRSDFKADAAAAFASNAFGDNAESVIQETLHGAAEAGLEIKSVKNAIKNAALGDGAATRLVQSDYFKNAKPAEKARLLVQTLQQDSFDKVVNGKINSKINEFRKTRIITQLAGQGHFDQAQADRAAAEKAAETTQRVQQDLDTQRNVESAAAEETSRATENLNNEPTADNLKALTHAVTKQENMQKVTQEYEQSVKKAQQDQQSAEAKADQSADDAMNQARAIADEQIAQEDQRIADEDEQERIAQEQAEQEEALRQAEEDERTGKTAEESDNEKIDRFVDSFSADEETKERVRKQLKDRNEQWKLGKIDLSKRLTDAESMLALGALQRKLGIPIMLSDDIGVADGMYSSKDGVIYLNSGKANDGSMKLGQALVQVAMHEITHSLEETKHYAKYRDIVLGTLFGNGDKFDRAAYDLAIKQKQDLYGRNGENLTAEDAEKEIIADFAKNRLSDKDVVQRFMDAGMGGKMRNMLHNINQALKNFFSGMTGADRETAENLRRAERAFQKALNERAKTEVHPGSDQFSIAQFAQATQMTYDEKKQILKDSKGRIIDGVKNKVTADMIKVTPVGKLIDAGLSDDVFKGKDGKEHTQKGDALEMFAGLMNMIAMLKDHNLVWEIASGTLESTFSALKANSDTQYHDTVDFGTICAKTQAIVNVMSEVMLDRLKANAIARKEGRFDDVSYGLTRDDVLKIYNETHKAGLSVPCPVCYVFSHWMGVPSLLGQMSRFQHDYIVTGKDANGNDIHYGDGDIVMDKDGYATFDPVETEKAAKAYIDKMHTRYGDKSGVDARKAKINSEINKGEKRHTKLAADIENFTNQLKNENLKQRSRESLEKKLSAAKEEIEKNAANVTELDEELREVEAYNWITQSLMTADENGNYKINPDFRITPDEILLDMRRTGEFADRYGSNWAYRTSRGAGMGKSILPYSGASLGDIINGSQTRVATADNPIFNGTKQDIIKAIDGARNRAKRQNLIGGQRLQSTSDFRPEWGLDYVMAFLELQAAKSNAQMYTKVAEAVDLFASAGADVNLSIMGSGNGFHEATAEEIAKMTDAQKQAATVDDKVYVMDFSDVTGMEYGKALEKSKQYDNVQMILVGMNDTHIRLALAGEDIDFVIPWHSSGNSREVLSQLVASVEETLNTSSDYTNTQSDKFVSRKERYIDEATGKRKTRTVDNRTKEQKDMWNARIKILTGIAQKAIDEKDSSKGGLTADEQKYVFGKNANPYLADLYNRFYVKESDKCYGVALTSAQAKQIFPYEYWQTDPTKPGGTKETADENGRRFIEYCQAMGVVPRFSGVWDAKNKTVKNGNFAGAIYDANGKITGYDPNAMQKGYWKLLIDRKMYDLNGNYREQKQIDVSGIQIGDVEGKDRKAHLTKYDPATGKGSMLPTETSAKYGIPALERQAAEASEKLIRKPFDLTGTQKLYNDTLTDADLDDMLRQANVDYMDAVKRNDMEAAQEDVDFAAEQAGYTVKAYHGTPTGGFTVFDTDRKNFGHAFGKGIYYTDSESVAKNFTSVANPSGDTFNPTVYESYLNLGDNPLTIDYDQLYEENGNKPSLIDYIVDEEIKNNGEDATSIIIRNVRDGSDEKSTVYVLKDSSQVKSADTVTYDDNGNVIPLDQRFTGNKDIRYSIEDDLARADIDQQLIDAGVLTQEQINKMNKTDVGEGTRQWGTHMAQDMDELAEQAREYVLKHSAYQQDTNKEQIERAVEWFKKRTERLQKKYEESGETKDKAAIMSEVYTSALQQITDKKFNFRSADGQARMAVMMGMAIARDDTYGQVQIANQVNRQGTALGQALQSRKLFRLMTPQGRIATLTKMLDEQQQELYAKGKNVELKFSDWLIRAAGAAENEGEMDLVRAAAINELAEQIPANFADRVRNLRMLSMLANPRTHIRNIIGNAFFAPFVSLKNKFGAFGEIITGQEERTKTLAIASSKDVRAFAREQANTIRDVLTGEAKFTEATQLKKAQGKLGAFMDGLSDVNSRFLEGEDWFFLKGHFRRAFGGWMTANGYTVEQVKNDASLLAKGRQYAVDEAQKATYRDFNEAAAKLNALSRDSETIWGKGLGFVTDAVLPFKKTPANILRRGLEYSPLGIAKGVYSYFGPLHRYNQALQDLESGKITEMPKNVKSPNQVIDDICSGLSGSMIMGLGFLLAGSGAVTCGMDDDEDKFEKAKGRQKYSIKLFDMDVTYTMDWAAPMSMPFFVGAAIRDEVDNGGFDFEKAFNAITSISEPIFNLSMLDGLNTVFKTSQYDDTNELTQIGAKILSNYLSSYVPSALGAVNRALVDDKSRKAFVKSGEGTGVAGTFRYAWEQFENKIPGLSQTNIPVRDIWGRVKTEDLARRIAENFISPGYIEDYNNDPIINEMARLYTVTNNPDMIPKEDPEKSFSSKNVKYVYDAEQWDKLKEVRNGTAFEMLTKLINSDSYKDDTTTDAARAEMISRVWNYANQVGRKAVFPEYQMDNLGEDAIGTIANESKVSVYQTDMLHYLDDGDLTSYNNMVEAIRFEMGDDKTADAKIKEKIGNSYRDKYKAAYRKNDDDEMDRIKNILDDSGFSFKISDWEKAVDKEE